MKKKSNRGAAIAGKNGSHAIDDRVISEALEKHLDLALTEKSLKIIARKVGPANYTRVEEILAFVSNQDAWLQATNLSSAADTVVAKLSQRYPGVSPLAAFKIVNQATYGWR